MNRKRTGPTNRPDRTERGTVVSGPISADKVDAERVEWLWRERIPKGMLTVIAGRPDQGKGLLAAHVAAEVSQTSKVLYSAAEDSAGLMTRPRLEAAGAVLENVLLWRFAIPMNQQELHQLIVEQEIALVVMDPFASHLSGGIKRHSDNVRQVLGPLTTLIEKTMTSVLIIEHALKRVPTTGHPLDCIGGSSSGLPAASRAAYVFGVDPDDEDRRILAPAKFNIGPKPKALAFDIEVEDIDVVGDVPALLEDEELLAFDPMRLFANKKQPGKVGRPPDKRAAAAEWLTTYLADEGGPVNSGKVQEDAKQYGMSTKTLRRAAEDMGIVKHPPGGGRNCTWDLPEEVKDMMGLPAQVDDTDEAAVEAITAAELAIDDATGQETVEDEATAMDGDVDLAVDPNPDLGIVAPELDGMSLDEGLELLLGGGEEAE